MARWMQVLSQFDFQIEHRSGKQHGNADGLSRPPCDPCACQCYDGLTVMECLPCGGCETCVKRHEQWSSFFELDDVVPLSSKRLRTRNQTVVEEQRPEMLLLLARILVVWVSMTSTLYTAGQKAWDLWTLVFNLGRGSPRPRLKHPQLCSLQVSTTAVASSVNIIDSKLDASHQALQDYQLQLAETIQKDILCVLQQAQDFKKTEATLPPTVGLALSQLVTAIHGGQ